MWHGPVKLGSRISVANVFGEWACTAWGPREALFLHHRTAPPVPAAAIALELPPAFSALALIG